MGTNVEIAIGRVFKRVEHRLNAPEKTDEALMDAVRQGQDPALAELVRRYQQDIFRFCLHYLKEVEVARDTAQETFVRVYTASARFDVRRKFRPWVLCIARNLCLNELKRKKTVSMEAFEEYASSARDGSGEVFRYSGDGPDEALMAQERRELLERALNALDDGARELVMMRFFERLSAKDIAEVVGSTEGAVRTRLHRVLSGMRTQYRAQSEDL